jgi:hypothetical protein
VALGARSGYATLHLSGGASDASSSLLKPKRHLDFHPDVTFPNTLQVYTLTLDEWARENQIDRVDFVWFDLQGMEYDVLRSSPRISSTIKMLYSEVGLFELYEDAPVYAEYKDWLESHGFKVIAEYLHWRDGGNVLFSR